uniref:Uncharacterized protein n=1 Tax=Arundo donax TaxID=35708 RepID=A0A0A9G9L0_ARUDO
MHPAPYSWGCSCTSSSSSSHCSRTSLERNSSAVWSPAAEKEPREGGLEEEVRGASSSMARSNTVR